ncbi:hypothetical protein ANANG_G00056290 [Anguilla anguilla]|uniref:Uncharacterized protein n=1 Tax=Anguilla anguilla TaxID=7936 RepID=A0A9D3MSC9_ANGAN|nr:hypothetical protein ANANG_G00056290 [Anguilla anguilla]
MGELCSGGLLSYPSPRRDVHNGLLLLLATLCLSSKQDKPLTHSSAKDRRVGEGFRFEPGLTDSPLPLSLPLSLYISLSYCPPLPSRCVFPPRFLEPLHHQPPTSHTFLHDVWSPGSSVPTVLVLKRQTVFISVVFPFSPNSKAVTAVRRPLIAVRLILA